MSNLLGKDFQQDIKISSLLKLDSTAFLKTVSESSSYERELILAAKHKFSVSSDYYFKQKNQIMNSYLKQFKLFQKDVCRRNVEYNSKKKEKEYKLRMAEMVKENALAHSKIE